MDDNGQHICKPSLSELENAVSRSEWISSDQLISSSWGGWVSGNALAFTPALTEKQDAALDGPLRLSPQAWHVKILNGGNQAPRTQVFIRARKARLLANVTSQTSVGTAGRFKDAEPHGGGHSVSESQLDEMCSEYLFFLSGHFMPLYLTAVNVFSYTSSCSTKIIWSSGSKSNTPSLISAILNWSGLQNH